jgi:putative membrane protein
VTGFLIRLAIGAFGLWVAARIVPGMHFDGAGTLVVAAFLLGLVNAVVRPLVILLTLPLTVLTLGLFLLVVNGLMLALVAALLPGFHLDGFGAAVLGAIVSGLAAWFASALIGPRGRFEVLVVSRERQS